MCNIVATKHNIHKRNNNECNICILYMGTDNPLGVAVIKLVVSTSQAENSIYFSYPKY